MDYYSALNKNEYWGNLVFKVLISSNLRVCNVYMYTCRQMYVLVHFNPVLCSFYHLTL